MSLKIANLMNFSKYDELQKSVLDHQMGKSHLVIPFLWMCKLYLLNANRIFKNTTQLIIYLEISIKTTCFQIPNKIPAAIVMLPANNIHVKNTLFVLSPKDNKNKVFSALKNGHFAVKNSLIIP